MFQYTGYTGTGYTKSNESRPATHYTNTSNTKQTRTVTEYPGSVPSVAAPKPATATPPVAKAPTKLITPAPLPSKQEVNTYNTLPKVGTFVCVEFELYS